MGRADTIKNYHNINFMSKEPINHIIDVIGSNSDDLFSELAILKNELLLDTAISTLDRLEKIFNIPINKDRSLEDRRKELFTRFNANQNLNFNDLENIVNNFGASVELLIDNENMAKDFTNWTLHPNAKLIDYYYILLEASEANQLSTFTTNAVENFNYSLNAEIMESTGYIDICFINDSNGLISKIRLTGLEYTQSTFVSPLGTKKIRLELGSSATGNHIFRRVMLNQYGIKEYRRYTEYLTIRFLDRSGIDFDTASFLLAMRMLKPAHMQFRFEYNFLKIKELIKVSSLDQALKYFAGGVNNGKTYR